MIRHDDWTRIPENARGAVAALGNFDGVHRGHAHLLHALHAARPDRALGVVTFDPHPRCVFRPQDPPLRLTLPDERDRALAGIGVRHVFQIGFDLAFSHLDPARFVNHVLHDALGLQHVACGPDFAFGHRRRGDVAMLETLLEPLGIGLTIVPPLSDISGPLSSTRIRRLLQEGYPERAAEELGRPWSICGAVEHGDRRGRQIGFPTANVPLGQHIEPARGVYAVTAHLSDGRTRPGVANVGRRPTFNDGVQSRLEAHLFDFDGDLYGQPLKIALHTHLREERRFDGIEALKHQIARDAEQARAVLDAT